MPELHSRCHKPVLFTEVSEGYYAQCPECDEDVFAFEVEIDEEQLGLYCPFCMDNKMSCGSCDDSYEGE